MAAIYSLSATTFLAGVPAVNTAIFEILPAVISRPKIVEMYLDWVPGTTATPPCIAFGSSATTGIPLGGTAVGGVILPGPYTPTVLPDDTGTPGPNNFVQILTAWSTPPTQPAAFYRRITPPSTIATPTVNVYWEFYQGLTVPPGYSASVWLVNTTAHATTYQFDLHVVMES